MDENQKYGVVTMIISLLFILLALMISNSWSPQLGLLDNLMNSLRIQLFLEETLRYTMFDELHLLDIYLIDVPTKYVILTFMSTAAYGLTTYLSITPAFKPWKKSAVK